MESTDVEQDDEPDDEVNEGVDEGVDERVSILKPSADAGDPNEPETKMTIFPNEDMTFIRCWGIITIKSLAGSVL